ncbi:hypothetical protein BKA62DRAFT_676859 [Auriculariales sp. MPI-PUGE-AT-0066]|nr:hypothetical protein BKA62DRAFT_676859 [Auriculariales sp. MPI-PUGE-AT-0066]
MGVSRRAKSSSTTVAVGLSSRPTRARSGTPAEIAEAVNRSQQERGKKGPRTRLDKDLQGDSDSMAISKCLFTCHQVKTIGDALALLNSWYGPHHANGDEGQCNCDGCADSGACPDPLACRPFLRDLMEAKDVGRWDGTTYPNIPDDLLREASSIYAFTLGWNKMITTTFDKSMRRHFVAYFKSRQIDFADVPDRLVDSTFLTYAQTLHRYYQALPDEEIEMDGNSEASSQADEADTIDDDSRRSDDELVTGGPAFKEGTGTDTIQGNSAADQSSDTYKGPSVSSARRFETSERRVKQLEARGLHKFFGGASAEEVDDCFSPDATSDDERVADEDGTVEYLHRPLVCRSKVFTAVARSLDANHARENHGRPGRQVHAVNYKVHSKLPPRNAPSKKASNWYDKTYTDQLSQQDPLEAGRLQSMMQPSIKVDLVGLACALGLDELIKRKLPPAVLKYGDLSDRGNRRLRPRFIPCPLVPLIITSFLSLHAPSLKAHCDRAGPLSRVQFRTLTSMELSSMVCGPWAGAALTDKSAQLSSEVRELQKVQATLAAGFAAQEELASEFVARDANLDRQLHIYHAQTLEAAEKAAALLRSEASIPELRREVEDVRSGILQSFFACIEDERAALVAECKQVEQTLHIVAEDALPGGARLVGLWDVQVPSAEGVPYQTVEQPLPDIEHAQVHQVAAGILSVLSTSHVSQARQARSRHSDALVVSTSSSIIAPYMVDQGVQTELERPCNTVRGLDLHMAPPSMLIYHVRRRASLSRLAQYTSVGTTSVQGLSINQLHRNPLRSCDEVDAGLNLELIAVLNRLRQLRQHHGPIISMDESPGYIYDPPRDNQAGWFGPIRKMRAIPKYATMSTIIVLIAISLASSATHHISVNVAIQ